MRRVLPILALSLLGAGCGSEASVVERFAASEPAMAATPEPATARPRSAARCSLTITGYRVVHDEDPDLVVLRTRGGRQPGLRLELCHRVGGRSQPDAMVVFLDVPARSGSYELHSPERPPLPGRVYAYLSTRGDAVGSLKEFNALVHGTLTLRLHDGALAGSFHLTAQEPQPPPPATLPGQPPPQSAAGTVPPSPPARVEAQGRLRAVLPAATGTGGG